MMDLIEVNNVSKWFGDIIALNSLSLNIDPGITGVVGPNGSGKSTLFKLLLGLIKPNKGKVLVKGQDPWSNHKLMCKIGYLPDYEFLPENISGFDFLEFSGGLRGLDGWQLDEKIQEIGYLVDMIPHLDRDINGYSKGMKQKLKFASTLIHEPSLLILDEPLAGMDPNSKEKMIESIKRINEEGTDIMISSHVLHDIEKVTNDVVLIYRGRSIASGTISEIRSLLDRYPHNIVVRCDKPRILAKELIEYSWVTSVDINENHELVVKVFDPEYFFKVFSKMVIEKDHDIKEVYSKDEDLGSVFKYLMSD